MTKILSIAFLLASIGIAGCAPAPLYLPHSAKGAATAGEVPRDARGEPVWEAIPPAPNSRTIQPDR